MQRLRGKHQYSARYFFDGFCYYVDNRSRTIFRCCLRNETGCRAKIYIQDFDNLENEMIEVVGAHNHEGDRLLPIREAFLLELEILSRTTFDDLRAIYDTIKKREE